MKYFNDLAGVRVFAMIEYLFPSNFVQSPLLEDLSHRHTGLRSGCRLDKMSLDYKELRWSITLYLR